MVSLLQAFLVFLFCSFASSSSIPRRSGPPKVKVGQATYVGINDPIYKVDEWLGIRYAKPPIGPLRLQPPQSYDAKGEVSSQIYGYSCFQIDAGGFNQSEDCLYLNVYTPRGNSEKYEKRDSDGLPVMLWIHGGGFNDGSGNYYNAESLVNTSVELKSPVIVVTINYRLSFFGFSAGTVAIANNALNLGLLDQRFAIQWIHDHIDAFGGDPHKVTLFGQSAGATSTGLQMTAYDGKSENLFRAAILESGSPSDTLPTPPPTWPTYQLAWNAVIAGIGCAGSANVFSCVQSAPSELLFAVIRQVATASPLPSSVWPWQPVIDGKFVKDFPSKLTASGNFAKIPMIMGFTTDEVTYVIPIGLNISSDAAIVYLGSAILPNVPVAVIEEILALDPLYEYPDTDSGGGTEWKRTTEIASDLFERCPGREWIRNVTKFAPTWKYRWNAIIPQEEALAPWEHIVHASDIGYVWGQSDVPIPLAPLELALSRQAQQAWISFASHLDPNALGPISPGVSWPRYRLDSEEVLVFQKPDGSGEQANGTAGTPVGQGLHTEKDPDDRPVCDYFAANDALWVH